MIIEEAGRMGFALASPREAERRGGSIMLRLPEGLEPPAIVDGLRKREVFADCRGRILRLSPGIVTTEAGVERLFGGLRELGGRPS